ncbi:DUF5076 domain-containing protein [Mesorhizobium sp.]|uniref:DUF5076 domain-containing protein n=1 Tax=Mesorhizobium sp. TaxID=1871066 RepID=UPI003BA9A374
MFGKPKNDLSPPPNAKSAKAVEVLRVWAEPGTAQQLVLRTTRKEPGAWGLLLADVARHAAKAYATEGLPEAQALDRILQLFQAEFAERTGTPS